MPDREKVIEGLEQAKNVIERWVPMFEQYNTPFAIDCAITMLKEQEDLGTELTNAVELIHKKNKRIEKLLKEREQKWISVEDRLPEIRHAVLAYSPLDKNIWAVSMHEDGEWYYWLPASKKYDPDWQGHITHWMLLPEIPGG